MIRLLILLVLLLTSPAVAANPIEALLRAYPDELASFDGTNLIWRDGTRMPVGDREPEKTFAEMLRNGSILDQMRNHYPAFAPLLPPTADPGRIRNRAFFKKMYGDCRKDEVGPKLVPVVWLPHTWGHTVLITSVNGVNHALQAVSDELDQLPAADKKFLYPPGGTHNCRAVADTGEPSMHAFGAAIDINTRYANYWHWQVKGDTPPPYVNRIPPEIVATFERHGFIWGGRWAHFDTMHFEYRPELINGGGGRN
jgi:hypothetical protein